LAICISATGSGDIIPLIAGNEHINGESKQILISMDCKQRSINRGKDTKRKRSMQSNMD